MPNPNPLLTSDAISMLVSSMTRGGEVQLQEIEVERFLNAVARAQLGVPTGAVNMAQNR